MSSGPNLFRRDYSAHKLDEGDLTLNPLDLFKNWFSKAAESGETDVNAMTLSTASKDGLPFSRIVLFKGLNESETGFVFFTNFNSRKGKQLMENPWAALNFYWPIPERQINIRGKVEKVKNEISDEYFRTRPRQSQISAWASQQSEVIESRELLEEKFSEIEKKFTGMDVPRPNNWGGFSIEPDFIEFWQGRVGRLHDRFLYSRNKDNGWKIERLSP